MIGEAGRLWPADNAGRTRARPPGPSRGTRSGPPPAAPRWRRLRARDRLAIDGRSDRCRREVPTRPSRLPAAPVPEAVPLLASAGRRTETAHGRGGSPWHRPGGSARRNPVRAFVLRRGSFVRMPPGARRHVPPPEARLRPSIRGCSAAADGAPGPAARTRHPIRRRRETGARAARRVARRDAAAAGGCAADARTRRAGLRECHLAVRWGGGPPRRKSGDGNVRTARGRFAPGPERPPRPASLGFGGGEPQDLQLLGAGASGHLLRQLEARTVLPLAGSIGPRGLQGPRRCSTTPRLPRASTRSGCSSSFPYAFGAAARRDLSTSRDSSSNAATSCGVLCAMARRPMARVATARTCALGSWRAAAASAEPTSGGSGSSSASSRSAAQRVAASPSCNAVKSMPCIGLGDPPNIASALTTSLTS